MEIPAVLGALLPKLGALLQEEYKLKKRAREEIVFLDEEVRKLKAVLDASEMRENRPADDFLRKLRDLSYDIEDTVDEFMLRAEPKPAGFKLLGPGGLIDKCKALLAELKNRSLAKELHILKSKMKEVEPQRSMFNIAVAMTSSVTMKNPHTPVLKGDASSLVGVDRPRDELIAKLQLLEEEEEELESAANLKVISIVGSGGLGKTTLARQVYQKIQASFDCRAWVSVLRNPNMENVLMGILRQVEDPHSSGAESNGELDLIRTIKRSLQEKRYLLVLDDIWSTREWEVIKSALPLNSFGSRVITTTRSKAVAASCCSDWNGYIYDVIPLSSKDSWMLFRRRIIDSAGSFPSHFVDVSDKILERCSGVPLSIITMSGLLANEPKWEDVYRKISTPSDGIEVMRNILLLSYYDLPLHLKVCFLYLSIFPEDYPINCDHIIRCWIAEGFVSENPTTSLEEVGESYLNELINRSMIQPVRGSYDGKPESFRIHSIILEFIKHISIKHNFVTLLNNEDPPSVLHSKIRRLSIININEDHGIPESIHRSHIRSLHIFGGVGMKLTDKHLSLLRVLDLEGCKDLKNHTIKEIHGLLSLRYLSIRDTPISELPDEIEQQLQENQLSTGCYLNRIPEWFISLSNLRYVSIDIKEVKNEDLQLLSKLRFLLHLSLLLKIVPTEKLVITSNGFQSLRVFHLYSARADLTFESQAMQNLEKLLLLIHVLSEEIFGLSIGQFIFLKKIDIRINGKGAYAFKLFEDANVSISKAANEHPNSPTVNIVMLGNLMDHAPKEGKEKEQEMELKEVS